MNTKQLILALVITCISANVFGQDSTPIEQHGWQVLFLAPGDQTATAQINGIIGTGYIPVGMENTPGESLAVLFVRRGSFEVGNWVIMDYEDWNALEGEITNGIQDGFVPMDISRYGETLAVLWVRTDLEIEGWRISTSPNSIVERSNTINDFQNEGFTLWGLSINDGLAWYLFLRTPGEPRAAAVSGYAKDGVAMRDGMVDSTDQGWVPNGIASADDILYIGYVR